MNKFILIPDSFKGTMSSEDICSIMEKAILENYPDAKVISIPVADGGEGSVNAFLKALKGERITATVKGPYLEEMEAFYGIVDNGSTAIIEMAVCAGLPLVEGNTNPSMTSTYGVGQLMEAAINRGCKRIILGLGGSCTNDGGTGAAAALGVRFIDALGNCFIPTGGTLKDIAHIDTNNLMPAIKDIEIITMCDIDNPLYGDNGAAYIFGPQKGATPDMVKELDEGLRHLDQMIQEDLHLALGELKGAGAAGGMGCGTVAFFGATLQMGIETILDTVKFDELLQDTDYVLSGEGKIDSQSLRGKVVLGIAKRTKKANVPLLAIVGGIGDGIEEAYERGVSGIFSINRVPEDFSISRTKSKQNLYLTVDNLMRFIKTIEEKKNL
ncbi:MAG TPA: glycerate kinase [Lachnospiraceae bacterium]|nr:glycerate kinase [Lachnospiraceae bacterium]